ncbi:Hypothetical_protein [Hexamita inflata]|uniref:Hypothetical_protein n=1 Tax=Hexamita inflata TaxID=28002 RepID=A0AA86QHF0_9EUKA|nr:Hypothetical protein HINF_LOCUS42308 [Hexamita inflata]
MSQQYPLKSLINTGILFSNVYVEFQLIIKIFVNSLYINFIYSLKCKYRSNYHSYEQISILTKKFLSLIFIPLVTFPLNGLNQSIFLQANPILQPGKFTYGMQVICRKTYYPDPVEKGALAEIIIYDCFTSRQTHLRKLFQKLIATNFEILVYKSISE